MDSELECENASLPGTCLPGERYGRLTVIGDVGVTHGRKRRVRAMCDCGRETEVSAGHLRARTVRSCGCLKRDTNTKHGHASHARSPEYHSWLAMIRRCESHSAPCYASYGGRGIKVCPRWRQSFASFLADMGPRPSLRYSLDRINNDGDYEPGNCRWASSKEQARNKSTNRFYELNGVRLTLVDWAKRLGVHKSALKSRLERGWTFERAVAVPVKYRRKSEMRKSVAAAHAKESA